MCTKRHSSSISSSRKKTKHYSRSSLYDRSLGQPLAAVVSTLRTNKSSNYDVVHQQRTFNRAIAIHPHPTIPKKKTKMCYIWHPCRTCRSVTRLLGDGLLLRLRLHWPIIVLTQYQTVPNGIEEMKKKECGRQKQANDEDKSNVRFAKRRRHQFWLEKCKNASVIRTSTCQMK